MVVTSAIHFTFFYFVSILFKWINRCYGKVPVMSITVSLFIPYFYVYEKVWKIKSILELTVYNLFVYTIVQTGRIWIRGRRFHAP